METAVWKTQKQKWGFWNFCHIKISSSLQPLTSYSDDKVKQRPFQQSRGHNYDNQIWPVFELCSQQQMAVNFQLQHMWKLPGRSSRSCYQFSLHATSLSRHVAVCTVLVCGVQCSMPVRLGHWQNQTSSVCSRMTGQWSDRSAVSGHKTLSPPGPMSYLCGLALRIWTSFWKREGSAGMDMWNAPMVQSRQPFTYRLRESMGLGGPRWHGSSWQRGIAEWKLSAINPHDRHTWRSGVKSAMRAASQLSGRGPTNVDVAPVPAR